MAKSKSSRRTHASATDATQETKASRPNPDSLKDRVVHLSEQMGSLLGTLQNKVDGLADRAEFIESMTQIRDGANDLLARLGLEASPSKNQPPGNGVEPGAATDTDEQAPLPRRARALVDAPGKRHRPPSISSRGVKHSDERIPKLKATHRTGRRGGRG